MQGHNKAWGHDGFSVPGYLDSRGADSNKIPKLDCMHVLKGLALPCANYPGEIALSGSRCLRCAPVAAPLIFAHAVVTDAKIYKFHSPI